jgi:hypothetical protein
MNAKYYPHQEDPVDPESYSIRTDMGAIVVPRVSWIDRSLEQASWLAAAMILAEEQKDAHAELTVALVQRFAS